MTQLNDSKQEKDLGRPLRVAVVGAGPSGMYAADALLRAFAKQEGVSNSPTDTVSIDIFDKLPTPYGLVRYGVAPDHHKIKSVVRLYAKTFKQENVRFFGNVDFGKDIDRAALQSHYDAIVYAVGASDDRKLGIAGEDLAGSLSATTFVAWYNGHPDYADFDMLPYLQTPRALVVGMGNVALDVARILAKSVEELRQTDIADHALESLAKSQLEEIVIVGRRGPAQAKFTSKELREFGTLEHADVVVDAADLQLDEASQKSIADLPLVKKNLEILQEFAQFDNNNKPKRIRFVFQVSPQKFEGGEGKLEQVVFERNRLEPQGDYLAAIGTGETFTLEAGLVLRSVGYRGVRLPDVPFDEKRGIIPNDAGRMLAENSIDDVIAGEDDVIAGEYVVGWAKRGPSGVIGTNKADSAASMAQLLADVASLPFASRENAAPEAIDALLAGKQVVDFAAWEVLDAYETAAGEAEGRARVKVTSVPRMLDIIAKKEKP